MSIRYHALPLGLEHVKLAYTDSSIFVRYILRDRLNYKHSPVTQQYTLKI